MSSGGQVGPMEAKETQGLHRGFEKLAERLESLETILLEKARN